MNESFFLHNLWRWKAGLPALNPEAEIIDLTAVRESEWSVEFETLMRNRLVMGAFRYGLMRRSVKKGYDRIGSAVKRLEEYRRTGNTELLVDAANLCMVEFVTGEHPKKHFKAADGGSHVEYKE